MPLSLDKRSGGQVFGLSASIRCKAAVEISMVDWGVRSGAFAGEFAHVMEPCAREGAMSTAIPIADIGQKYLVTRLVLPYACATGPYFSRRLKFCSTGELENA